MYTVPRQIGCQGLSGIDLSTLTPEDYLLMGIAGAVIYELFAGGKPKRRRRKSSGFDSWGTVAAITAAGVAGYFVWTSGTQLGAALAQGTTGTV